MSREPQNGRAVGRMWGGGCQPGERVRGGANQREGLKLGAGPGTPRGSARPGQPLTPLVKVCSGSQ